MSTEKRIWLCRLLERINSQETYSKKLGLVDASTYHGEIVKRDSRYLKEEM